MPRCPPGSRRCPPKTGKCHKRSKNNVKRNKTAKKSPASVSPSPAAVASAEASDSPMPKLKWIDHLKMCSKKFNIKFGDAMKDPRCLKLYRESR